MISTIKGASGSRRAQDVARVDGRSCARPTLPLGRLADKVMCKSLSPEIKRLNGGNPGDVGGPSVVKGKMTRVAEVVDEGKSWSLVSQISRGAHKKGRAGSAGEMVSAFVARRKEKPQNQPEHEDTLVPKRPEQHSLSTGRSIGRGGFRFLEPSMTPS